MQVINAPFVSQGYRTSDTSETGTSSNPYAGPSALFGGEGLFDNRVGYNVGPKGFVAAGLPFYHAMRFAPATLSSTNIAAAAVVVNGTPMVLASASGSGIVIPTTAQYVWGSGNTVPVGAVTLDVAPAVINYGLANANSEYVGHWYDPATMTGRAVSITAQASGVGGAFIISGADMYGFPQTEQITAVQNSTVNGKKGWKFIYSVVPQFSDPTFTYSCGTTDIYEFPIRVDFFEQCLIWDAGSLITASTGFVGAVTTTTTTSGSVRGTYALQTPANGTNILAFATCMAPSRAATNAGTWGTTPA